MTPTLVQAPPCMCRTLSIGHTPPPCPPMTYTPPPYSTPQLECLGSGRSGPELQMGQLSSMQEGSNISTLLLVIIVWFLCLPPTIQTFPPTTTAQDSSLYTTVGGVYHARCLGLYQPSTLYTR